MIEVGPVPRLGTWVVAWQLDSVLAVIIDVMGGKPTDGDAALRSQQNRESGHSIRITQAAQTTANVS